MRIDLSPSQPPSIDALQLLLDCPSEESARLSPNNSSLERSTDLWPDNRSTTIPSSIGIGCGSTRSGCMMLRDDMSRVRRLVHQARVYLGVVLALPLLPGATSGGREVADAS